MGLTFAYKLNFWRVDTATLRGAWMVEYLGEPEIRNAIFDATEQVINEGKYVTYDIGGNAKTSEIIIE